MKHNNNAVSFAAHHHHELKIFPNILHKCLTLDQFEAVFSFSIRTEDKFLPKFLRETSIIIIIIFSFKKIYYLQEYFFIVFVNTRLKIKVCHLPWLNSLLREMILQ